MGSLLDGIASIPGDSLTYEIALLIMACAFALYALVLRSLLALIGRQPFWLLPLAGSVLLVAAAIVHGFTAAVLTPLMPVDADIYRQSMALRTVSLSCLLACGVLGLASGWIYYHEMGE